MAIEKTDVVIVGMGAVGGVMAAELGKAGMKVIGLERGPRLKTADFQLDELRYFQRKDLRPSPKTQPVTWRPNANSPAMRLPQAMELASTTSVDFAILDVNLDGRMSFPVADLLSAKGVPFVFATGYGSGGLDERYRGEAPVVKKPFRLQDLRSAIDRSLGR